MGENSTTTPVEDTKPTVERVVERDENGRLLKGSVLNPEGRPKGSVSITNKVRQMLQETPQGQTMTYLEAIVKVIMKKAIEDKDFSILRLIWAYMDGNPVNTNEITGAEGTPLFEDKSVYLEILKEIKGEAKKLNGENKDSN